MDLSKLDRYMIDHMGALVHMEHLVKMVKAEFYMRDEDEFYLLDRMADGRFEKRGHVIVRNGALVNKTEVMLAKYMRKAVKKEKPVRVDPPMPASVESPPSVPILKAEQPKEQDMPSKNRKIRECADTEPIYLRKLSDALGNRNEVGRRIGVGGTLVSRSLQDNQTRLVNELAARYVFERDFAQPISAITDDGERLKEAVNVVRELCRKLDVEPRIENGEIKLRRLVFEEI